MFSLEKPDSFDQDSAMGVAGCFVYDEVSRILLLQRNPKKGDPLKWGSPGGKIDHCETPEEGVIREVYEETGIKISSPKLIATLYVEKYDKSNFVYYLFQTYTSSRINLILNPDEHIDAKWTTKDEALDLDLIHDLDECIKKWMK